MGKLKMSSCPRCYKGEVFLDRDIYGWYECCLQCGYSRDLSDLIVKGPVSQPETGAVEETVPKIKDRSPSKQKRA